MRQWMFPVTEKLRHVTIHVTRGTSALPWLFMALQEAMEACFGFRLDSSYKEKVEHFATCYKNLNLSITTKVHVLVRHVPEFIDKHQMPLGHFCEQVVEQCHAKFDKLFNSYKIKDVHHPNYLSNLFHAIMHFNLYHI